MPHRLTAGGVAPRPPQTSLFQLNVRALLKSTATPFAVADYGPRATIFLQGEPGDSVMLIETGRVWLAVTARNGKEGIVGVLEAGSFLGEEALRGQPLRRQTATALTAAGVLVVAKAQMLQLLHTHPAIADRFIAHMLARNTRLEADLADQLLLSSEQRLARCQCILPDVSQEIIAEMVGTTRSRVNAFMGKFKKLGFIEEDGGELRLNPSHLPG